ncbi:MAG TPA: hypothetical protein PKA10_20285 [Selenomonadales bacterium]|nr:hypothetical protein [Selenomonadales bacterium]
MSTMTLLKTIEDIAKIKPPGKKALQKLIYLAQRKGANFGFPFAIHYYGPYSSSLDYALQSLIMQGAVELHQWGFSSLIQPTGLSIADLDSEDDQQLSGDQLAIIKQVVDKFAPRTPKELELLTTTDFVAQERNKKGLEVTRETIVQEVKKIKGDKFSVREIEDAIDELGNSGYLM